MIDPAISSRAVNIVPYDPNWPKWAQQETDRLASVLVGNLITVEHIGSTAVPGLAAKPIVDLIPIVQNLEGLDQQQAAIEALGYQWRGEYGLAERRYCTLTNTNGERIAHLHFYPVTAFAIRRHLAFRDYLRTHPAVAADYQREKYRAAQLHPYDSFAYSQEKAPWVQQHEAKALAWFDQAQSPISPSISGSQWRVPG